MDYLARLKNLKTSRIGTDKTDITLSKLAQENFETPTMGADKTDKSSLCPEQKISGTAELGIAKSEKTLPVPPSYICRCPQCGGIHWGRTGTLDAGCEIWGCLDCTVSSADGHAAQCPMCFGPNLVTDTIGKYCIDCLRRPWERKPAESVPEPKYIGVQWSSEKGHLQLTDPVRGETAEIVAKGAPRWLFNRLQK